jgi:hypothetical protein
MCDKTALCTHFLHTAARRRCKVRRVRPRKSHTFADATQSHHTASTPSSIDSIYIAIVQSVFDADEEVKTCDLRVTSQRSEYAQEKHKQALARKRALRWVAFYDNLVEQKCRETVQQLSLLDRTHQHKSHFTILHSQISLQVHTYTWCVKQSQIKVTC